jgi:NMD protein affecting ribosome stability and mRNA decay
MKNKNDVAFTLAFVAYKDGSYEHDIKIVEGQEKIAAGILFSMMNTTMAEVLSSFIKEKYPKQYPAIEAEVNAAYDQFMERTQMLIDGAPDRCVVDATEVFGGKRE